MSTKNNKVSKLVIKACSDNKFSSFTGEFITSINPENLAIKSAVSYYVPGGMTSSSLLKYRGSPPKLLSFSLLFDNTGIIPGSNTIAVMEQVKQLQDVAYNVHKKNNAPNYIRVIWGQIDFKGRLVDLDVIYSMFQVDGTLVRAEAHITVLEELVPVGKGKSAAGVDSEYTKASGANATSNRRVPAGQATPNQDVFAPTPNGMDGAYSGAPPGAYDGGPDQVYHGSNGAGRPVYASSSVATAPSGNPASNAPVSSPSHAAYDSGYESDASTGSAARYGSSTKGGVAGNGPGGSGPGIGGGGHGPGSGPGKSGGAAAPSGAGGPTSKSSVSGGSRGAGSGPAGSAKSNVAPGSGGTKGPGSISKMGKAVAAGAAGSAAVAGAAGAGAGSLRKLKGGLNIAQRMKEKASFWRRMQKLAKRVLPKKLYEGTKKLLK